MKKIAVNGFGRIGRAFVRMVIEKDGDELVVVAINDLMDLDKAVYLFKYDTTHGNFAGEVKKDEGSIVINGKKIKWLNTKEINKLPWKDLNIDLVVEATGVFTNYELSQGHIESGAKKVLITGPVKQEAPENIKGETVLFGVNEERTKTCDVVSNASCTTNAVGIPLKILDTHIGVEKAILNTVHAYTASQPIVDLGSKKSNRLGRAGAQNIIPTGTGAAIATTKVLDSLKDKFDGVALRVPVISGSIADITFIAKKNTSVEEVNEVLKSNHSKLFSTTEEDVVSSDIIGQPYAAIADLNLTRVVDGNLVKVFFWYDNEEGYTSSLIEQAKII